MPTREENRRQLYNLLKNNLKVTIRNKTLTLGDLENTNDPEQIYQIFKGLYFDSLERKPGYVSSGTLDIHKLYLKIIPNAKHKDVNDFFQWAACDLPYARISNYCEGKLVNPKDYVGEYELYIYGTDTEYDTAKIEFKLDISMSDALQMSFVKKIKYFRFKYQNKTDSFDLLNEDSITKLGQIKFSRDDEGNVDGMEFIEFEEGGMPVKLEGIKITEGEIEVDFNPYDEEDNQQSGNQGGQGGGNNPTPPPPPPPKKRYQNHCSDMSWPWIEGCQNGYIEVLNDRVLGKKGDPTLSQELIQNLRNLSVLSSGATNISKDDFNNRIKPTYGKYFTNVIEENHIKKVIKESTRRILRDIYNRT